jgi:hypothetical protein
MKYFGIAVAIVVSLALIALLVLPASTAQAQDVPTTPVPSALEQKLDVLIGLLQQLLDQQTPAPVAPANATVPVPPMAPSMAPAIQNPELFDGQSTGKEHVATYDLGVNQGQYGLVFGVQIEWLDGNAVVAENHGCALVALEEGWASRVRITDGRYEVYNIPQNDPVGWKAVLTEQRVTEQASHYGCPSVKTVPVWDSTMPSPPEEAIAPVVPAAPAVEQPAAPMAAEPEAPASCETVDCEVRVPTSETGGTAPFTQGDAVVGYTIAIGTQTFTACFFESAPASGTVTDGVVHPWVAEVASATPCQ